MYYMYNIYTYILYIMLKIAIAELTRFLFVLRPHFTVFKNYLTLTALRNHSWRVQGTL